MSGWVSIPGDAYEMMLADARRGAMGHCRDCEHWGGLRVLVDAWESCELAAGVGGGPMCDQSLAYASDREEYAADLFTSPDYGCVQFAAREPAE